MAEVTPLSHFPLLGRVAGRDKTHWKQIVFGSSGMAVRDLNINFIGFFFFWWIDFLFFLLYIFVMHVKNHRYLHKRRKFYKVLSYKISSIPLHICTPKSPFHILKENHFTQM